MESRMEGRRFMKLNTLSRYIVKGEITGDWVTMAVVVGKLPPKTAANVSGSLLFFIIISQWTLVWVCVPMVPAAD